MLELGLKFVPVSLEFSGLATLAGYFECGLLFLFLFCQAVVRAVINVLTNEEQSLGMQQPAGIGQRPRPMCKN